MSRAKDSFSVNLLLPKGIYIDFMFWAAKNEAGDSTPKNWDINWGNNYNHYIDGKGIDKIITDKKLFIEPKLKKHEPFQLLQNGRLVLVSGMAVLLLAVLVSYFARRTLRLPTGNQFLIGFFISSCLLAALVRLQLNGLFSQAPYLVFGASYSDLVFISCFALIAVLLLRISWRVRSLYCGLQILTAVILFIVTVWSLANIEIIRQVGKPINYNWLYYSGFLKSVDAQNALKKNITPAFVANVAYILSAGLLAAYGIAFLLRSFNKKPERIFLPIASILLLLLATGFVQKRQHKFNESKVVNPVSFFLSSVIQASKTPPLFSVKVSRPVEDNIIRMHEAYAGGQLQPADAITNVVVFVMESTPTSVVQMYDSTYRVTPNLDKWKSSARIFTNMYAHQSNTANTMFSLLSGVYPPLGYVDTLVESPKLSAASLPGTLKQYGWNSSLFFSSDLTYYNLGRYAARQQVGTLEDSKNMDCNISRFQSEGYFQLEGLDDHCIVNRYLRQLDETKNEKRFSILWTNQTHYPYFVSKPSKAKLSDNADLNSYLNALAEVDERFGKLMAGLQERKVLDQTLVVVVGDHGEAFGTHSQTGHATYIYEENIHIPCMLINPRLFKGKRDDRMGGVIDIAPTIAHILGIERGKTWQGQSLMGSTPRDHSFVFAPLSDPLFGSRFGNWKFIYNSSSGEFELYDLAKDPKEVKNVADQFPSVARQEYEMVAAWAQYHNRKMKELLTR
jgi:arylsulfatase A-like enzyme